MKPQPPFLQLVDKIDQNDIIRIHIDRDKIGTDSALSSSINNISMDIDNLTIDDIHTMEQNIAYKINVAQRKY